ncbi:hydroxyacid dehydrogenase [Chelatococcus asaccharovorans]|uniref:Lactate dehydrogenase-like 2-hydroxyacid dehydrogenase n=1 Tax=Chelatococcus asaccharovorans TaxID=28210 RepID=A0A2V3TZ44_9HYPH|nr:hydroxyacid dehydrogenase [Chelatococcus asaccharovorans]MBS7706737.1 hydroxyacid dehydrogenase [Chelatococcus asaccharovorans]PXW54119.1 lactate dehydrogenase-like 2-hydroxyacid dehydrogenase [Chelatococcus asaccharovorans]
MSEPAKPTVAILLTPQMRKQLIPPGAEAQLSARARVVAPADGELSAAALPGLLEGATVAITGWGTPRLDEAVLAQRDDLQLVAHAAGSIRQLVPFPAIESDRLRVTHSAVHIGEAVAEFVMAQVFNALRHPVELAEGMRAREPWLALRSRLLGRLLGEQTVGLAGAGYIGRMMVRQFKAFSARVLMHDPFLDDARVTELGVELVSLDQLLAESDIISLHVPSLPETRHMIGAAQLARVKDGALFINTARGALIDEEALIAELRKGRFTAVLDVYEKEPLADDSPLRALPNAILAPHAAGHTHETYLRQGATAVDEALRFLAGAPLRHEVTKSMLPNMA